MRQGPVHEGDPRDRATPPGPEADTPPGPEADTPPGHQTDAPPAPATTNPRARLAELIRARAGSTGVVWHDPVMSAALGYLALLVVGAGLLVAAKLQFPALGSGFNPLSIVTAMTILGLAALGAPLHIGPIEVLTLPLGGLAIFGMAFAGFVRLSRRARRRSSPVARAVAGTRSGIVFGLLCGIAALVFRFRGGPDQVAVEALPALALGLLWGSVFGAVGGMLAGLSRGSMIAAVTGVRARFPVVYEGVVSAGAMLAAGLALSVGAVLVWIIVVLARGSLPAGFGLRDAAAAFLYLLAFAPNVAVSLLALSLGAPVEVGGRVTVGGRDFGGLQEYSLVEWAGGDPPWYLFALLLIPIVACAGAGLLAFRNARDPDAVLEVIGVGALVFAAAVLVLASVGDARLGAGLLGGRGVARAAPNAFTAAVLACGWGAALGFAGWNAGRLLGWRSTT
jgi:hypothetical protein